MHTFIRRSVTAIFLLCCTIAKAQQQSITGVVKDAATFIPAATVSLLHAKDSTWISSTLTDDNGAFTFTNASADSCLISITALGYKAAIIPATEKPLLIVLQKENASLKEVTITGKQEFIKMDLGKTTVNVSASPTTVGLNVLELLRRMPGITVDQASNISMQGKDGVLVLIDDRPTYLSADQLADYLKAMPADELEQVELITQPSAKYDASGNAGIINLKRKHITKAGLNGTATLTQGQGIYPYTQASALLNYRRKKLNLLLAADEHYATGFADWTQTQQLSDPLTGSLTSLTTTHSTPVEHFSIANVRVAADYDITDKLTTGISIKGAYHTNSMVDHVYSTTYDIPSATTTYNTIVSPEGFIRKDLTANAYLSYKLSNEHTLNFNFDYLNYDNSPYQNITNTNYDAQMQPLPGTVLLQSYQPTLIHIYSLKGDYTDTLQNGIRIETGFKSSLVTTDNNALFNTYQNNEWIADTTRTNRFTYKENINALYISGSKTLNARWSASAGLRAENTNAQGIQQVGDKEFNRDYISLFPTAYLSYKADKDNELQLNYGRRIDRPSYQSLNPFIYYSFQYTYSVGNPYLQPQFTNSIELKHSYKNMLITSLSVNQTNGVINDLLVPNNTTGVVYSTKTNIGTNKSFTASVVFNKDLFKWWSLNTGAVFFTAYYNGLVGTDNITARGNGYFFNMTNQFSFTHGWKAACGVYYNGRFIESITAQSLPSVYMNLGVTKKLSPASTLKMSIEDPFYLYRFKNQTSEPGLAVNAVYRNSTQQVWLAYTYTFGSAAGKQRDVAAPDESKRIN